MRRFATSTCLVMLIVMHLQGAKGGLFEGDWMVTRSRGLRMLDCFLQHRLVVAVIGTADAEPIALDTAFSSPAVHLRGGRVR